MEQSTILLQDLGVKPKQIVVDLGYRGKEVEQANEPMEIIHRGKIKTMSKTYRKAQAQTSGGASDRASQE